MEPFYALCPGGMCTPVVFLGTMPGNHRAWVCSMCTHSGWWTSWPRKGPERGQTDDKARGV
jgi:hypothetical protein